MTDFHLPVPIQSLVLKREKTTIYYPYIFVRESHVQNKLNRIIYQTVIQLVEEQQKYQTATLSEMIGHFEIKTNERGILSILLSNYAYSAPMAHGMTLAKSLNLNVETAELYQLHDMFKPNSDYISVLSKNISAQIKKRQIPLIDDFTSIRPDQDFYLSDKCLVIYFGLYEITPYYVGFPMFPISVYALDTIMKQDGPLATLTIGVI